MSTDTIHRSDGTDCGRKPLQVAALMATAVVSAFVLLMTVAGIAAAIKQLLR